MAKGIDRGQKPPDDPMFSGGPQLFSMQRFRPSPTPTTGEATEAPAAGDSLAQPPAQEEGPETEEDGIRAEGLRRAKVRQMTSKPGGEAAAPAPSAAEDPLQPFMDSNLKLFSGGASPTVSGDEPEQPTEPGRVAP